MVNPFSQTVPYSGAGWLSTGGAIGYDGFDQRVEWVVNRNGANEQAAKDLTDPIALGIPIDDLNWRLRLHLQWPIFNSFRNTGGLFELGNTLDIVVSDSDQTFNTVSANQKYLGCRITNFDGNDPTPAIRAGGSPVPPNGFRGLLRGIVKDGPTLTATANFTPGGQPGSQSTTHVEVERSGSNLIITLFTGPAFSIPIEQKMLTIPAGITGLKYLKFSNFDVVVANHSLISGQLPFYEFLSGQSFTPIMPIFPSGLAAKIYNDLGINGPSTGDEVFTRIFGVAPTPESWSRIRERHMYGFLENDGLIQRDVDRVSFDITTWSVV